MPDTDTIAAIATPPGRGGVGIVRVSGPGVRDVAQVVAGSVPPPRRARHGMFRDTRGELIDEGLVLYFRAPASFTGEDVLELHGHGGPVVMDLLLAAVLEAGARPAAPGEFTQRAFLNGKLDLAQAEAVADLIDSGSAAAARGAVRSLQGAFSSEIHQAVDAVTQLRAYVEASLDFPDEEVDFLKDEAISAQLDAIYAKVDHILANAEQGTLLREGMTVVLAGRPNAGKSSILNALSRHDRAIVSEFPGTTRDLLREEISLDGLPLHVVDTAGLRESADAVESEGVRRAHAAIAGADRVLVVIDQSCQAQDWHSLVRGLPAGLPCTLVHNKIDLSGETAGVYRDDEGIHVYVSARSGDGMDLLRAHLKESMGFHPAGEGAFTARRRHLDALRRAREAIETGAGALHATRSGELLAEELRQAQAALSEITGEFTSEDLLGRIFASFCIGK